jgi:hypothetical protein
MWSTLGYNNIENEKNDEATCTWGMNELKNICLIL